MKKILAMLLSVAIIATIAIGGSIAYLQDTDETVNTMEMGNVDIEQIEQERDANGERVAFRNAQKLYPATYKLITNPSQAPSTGTEIPAAVVPDKDVATGFYKEITGAMDKIVSVKNVGKSDAYIRTWFAFEADDAKTLNYIHRNWNTQPDNTGEFANGKYVEIAGNGYIVFCVTYPEAIKAGESTPVSLMQVCMDKAATNEYVAQFGDTYEILVLSQGVQAENFENAAQAFTNAFGNQHPWTGRDTIAVPTIVKTKEELKTELGKINTLKNGEALNIVLGADIDLKNWETLRITSSTNNSEGAATVVIDGAGHTLSNLSYNNGYVPAAGLISILEGNIDLTIRDLNVSNVNFAGNNSVTNEEADVGKGGAGALIGYAEMHGKGEIHIENVNVTGANISGYKNIGGLIGYESTSKGTTITNCSVNGSTLNSTFTKNSELTGHVGGLIGYHTRGALTNNTVKNTVITGSTDAKRAGALGGTVYNDVTVSGNKCINVTVNGVAATASGDNANLLGSGNSTADATDTAISTDNTTLISNNTEFTNAVANGNGKTVTLTAGTYEFTDLNCVWDNVTIVGNPGVVIKASRQNFHNVTFEGVTFEAGDGNGTTSVDPTGDKVVFKNCTFNADTADNRAYWGDSTKVKELIFENCVFNNGIVAYGPKDPKATEDSLAIFKNCTFNFASVKWGNIRSYCNTKIENCTFNLNGVDHRLTNNVTVTVTGGNYFNKVVWKGTGTVVNGESST